MRVVEDPARGVREVRYDDAGRPVEVRYADDARLLLSRDAAGRLRSVKGSDGSTIEIDPPAGREPTLRVTDVDGCTEVEFGGGWAIRRGASVLRVETDSRDRLRRVAIPGSDRALIFDWRGRDRCRLRVGEQVLMSVDGGAECERVDFGWSGWEERGSGFGSTIELTDGLGSTIDSVTLDVDLQNRCRGRRWASGPSERFERDGRGRLTAWIRRASPAGGASERRYSYDGGQWITEDEAGRRTAGSADGSGRLLHLDRAGRGRVEYAYDARGRRVERRERGATTRYRYNILGQLEEVTSSGGERVRLRYDGLGRRVSVETSRGRRFEHRDAEGRLWALTDADGRPLHTFVWWNNRVVARIDGPLGESVAEAYVSDPDGTPLALLRPPEAGSVPAVERLASSPFGQVGELGRPTLYGHFGDPETGLIHFGGRDLDPEAGLFLTPDPWHEGADDPRRWGGHGAAELAFAAERPTGAHPYALCRFDPVGRSDRDGHGAGMAVFRGFLNLILAPTWGMPLTSISLFFFLPFNIYAEIVAGFIAIFTQRHVFKNHTLFGLRGAMASARQGQISFALNGFLPRVISGGGITSDRAVTIGNVIWIHRRELTLLDRPTVLEVEDLAGRSGGNAFSDSATQRSVVAVEASDVGAGKKKVHVSYWTRGPGNALKKTAAGATVTPLTFDDLEVGGNRLSTLHLAKPFPFGYVTPDDSDDDDTALVREFVWDNTVGRQAQAELIEDIEFAIRMPTPKQELAVGDPIEITSAGAPFHATIGHIEKEEKDDDLTLAILHQRLPPALTSDLVVHRLTDDTSLPTTAGWAVGASATELETNAPADPAADPWPPPFAVDGLVRVEASTPVAAPAHAGLSPPPTDSVHARVEKLEVNLKVTEALPAGLGATDVTLLIPRPQGKVGSVTDAAQPEQIELRSSGGFEAEQLVSVTELVTGDEHYAQVDSLSGKDLELEYLGPSPVFPDATEVRVRRFEDRDDEDLQGTATNPSGDQFDVEIGRAEPLAANVLLHLVSGGDHAIRRLESVTAAKIELSGDVLGTGPFAVTPAKYDPECCRIEKVERAALKRFLRRTGGAQPSAFGSYDGAGTRHLINVEVAALGAQDGPLHSAFYLRSTDAQLHEDYRLLWEPLQLDGHEYFLLKSDLPILEKDLCGIPHHLWVSDPDDHIRELVIPAPAPNHQFVVRDFEFDPAAQATRGGAGQRKVTAHPPEVQVPVEPEARYSHGDALEEHEIHHTLQGNYWGPLLGAFPVQGLLLTAADVADAAGADVPDWFREFDDFEGSSELSPWQWFSIGGIMMLAWKFLFLGPFLPADKPRKEILDLNFSDWNRIFNPFWGNLIGEFPKLDPNLGPDGDAGMHIARLIARAMDLRSWTPFLGFVPTWLPDGPHNFIEQGASRMSGDLYSAILTADDECNAELRFRAGDGVPDKTDADLEKPLGDVVRLMHYAGGRTERLIEYDFANREGSPVVYRDLRLGVSCSHNIHDTTSLHERWVTVEATAAALLPVSLFEPRAAPPPRLQVDLPDGTTEEYWDAPAGTTFLPTLRAHVPLPPRVNRNAGFYFIPGSPGVFEISGYYIGAGNPDFDAGTQKVTLTFSGTVEYAGTPVNWIKPPGAGNPPPGPPVAERFVTEKVVLTMRGGSKNRKLPIAGFELALDPAGGAAGHPFTPTPRDDGWQLQIGNAIPGGAASVQARIRIFRVIKKNDAANDQNNDPAFDLTYNENDTPTLVNIRSYLEEDIWVPIRDFLVELRDLPALPNETRATNAGLELDLPLAVSGREAISITTPADAPSLPRPTREGDSVHPRGEVWRLGPLDKVIEDPVVYKVEVTFGVAPNHLTRDFDLRVQPVIHLTAVGGGDFEAGAGSPLELEITGGSAPYQLEARNLPDDTTAVLNADNHVVVTVTPPAPPEPRGPVEIVIEITDDDGEKGRRTVTALSP